LPKLSRERADRNLKIKAKFCLNDRAGWSYFQKYTSEVLTRLIRRGRPKREISRQLFSFFKNLGSRSRLIVKGSVRSSFDECLLEWDDVEVVAVGERYRILILTRSKQLLLPGQVLVTTYPAHLYSRIWGCLKLVSC